MNSHVDRGDSGSDGPPGAEGESTSMSVARGGTYQLRDRATGQIVRTGRANRMVRRQADHCRSSLSKAYEFIVQHETDDYAAQRGLEQMLLGLCGSPNQISEVDTESLGSFAKFGGSAGNFDQELHAPLGIFKGRVRVNSGEVYGVPLLNGGFGVAIIAQKSVYGALLGYFFGPRYEQLPNVEAVTKLLPADSLFCERFGDLGIQLGAWHLLGRLERWDYTARPLPEFGRIEPLNGAAWIVSYSGVDLADSGIARRCSPDEARLYPRDMLAGYKAVELRLTQRLPA